MHINRKLQTIKGATSCKLSLTTKRLSAANTETASQWQSKLTTHDFPLPGEEELIRRRPCGSATVFSRCTLGQNAFSGDSVTYDSSGDVRTA